MLHRRPCICGWLSLLLLLLIPRSAPAATSFSNPLTGFTGESTQPATQAALSAAGFGVSNTVDADPAVVFDSAGVHFGTLLGENGGRNYMRTIESDYADVRFVAEVTMAIPTSDVPPFQSGFIGLGAGDIGFANWPDWGTGQSAVMLVPELYDGNKFFKTMYQHDGSQTFSEEVQVPVLDNGTHRLRLTYELFPKSVTFAIDVNYAGGPFVSDYTGPTIPLLGLFGASGWPIEPARIYFGGDDGTLFKDFRVIVTGPTAKYGDFNSDGAINGFDWVILRTNQETDLSGLSLQDAYFRGDLTEDLANDHEDFIAFKSLYDGANGVGAFVAMLAAVPEPSMTALVVSAGLLTPVMRRARDRR